jgi:hypothetical protein
MVQREFPIATVALYPRFYYIKATGSAPLKTTTTRMRPAPGRERLRHLLDNRLIYCAETAKKKIQVGAKMATGWTSSFG